MQKKNQLKEYAFKLYNEHKDDKNLRVVKNIIWEALEELIDNYGQFMTEENINKVFQTRYTVKIDESFSNFRRGYKYFNKDGSLAKKEDYNITVSYPMYENEQGSVNRWQNEFSLKIDDHQREFFQDYLMGNKNLNDVEPDKDFEKLVKDNFKLILQHEMTHAMSAIEITRYDRKKKKVFALNIFERGKSYVHDIWGGLHCYSEKFDKNGVIDLDKSVKKDFMLLHEGITEYIAFNMKKEKVINLMGFDNYGEEYIIPAYTPAVWLAGCIDALNDNFLLKAYYGGSKVTEKQENYKQIKRKTWYFFNLLQETYDYYLDIREDAQILFELEDKLGNLKAVANSLGISNDRLKELSTSEKENILKNINYTELWKDVLNNEENNDSALSVVSQYAKTQICYDDMVVDFENIEKKRDKNLEYIPIALSGIAKFLYKDYNKKVSNNLISNEKKQEFNKCLCNLLDFDKTWYQYLAYEDCVDDIKNERLIYDELKEKYNKKLKTENNLDDIMIF